jgi:hypothetical protein
MAKKSPKKPIKPAVATRIQKTKSNARRFARPCAKPEANKQADETIALLQAIEKTVSKKGYRLSSPFGRHGSTGLGEGRKQK